MRVSTGTRNQFEPHKDAALQCSTCRQCDLAGIVQWCAIGEQYKIHRKLAHRAASWLRGGTVQNAEWLGGASKR